MISVTNRSRSVRFMRFSSISHSCSMTCLISRFSTSPSKSPTRLRSSLPINLPWIRCLTCSKSVLLLAMLIILLRGPPASRDRLNEIQMGKYHKKCGRGGRFGRVLRKSNIETYNTVCPTLKNCRKKIVYPVGPVHSNLTFVPAIKISSLASARDSQP